MQKYYIYTEKVFFGKSYFMVSENYYVSENFTNLVAFISCEFHKSEIANKNCEITQKFCILRIFNTKSKQIKFGF